MHIGLEKIELNGISFGSNTSLDEVLNNSKFKSYINISGPVVIFTSEQVIVDGFTFNIRVVFMNERLSKIQLTPVNLKMKDPGYPDEKYQEKKKKIADSFFTGKIR